jgi:glycosyltransferase involved in cell wall biosynthesis
MGHHVTLILPGAQDEIIAQGPFVRCHTRVHDGAWHGLDQRVANNVSWSLGAFATLAKLHSEHPVDVVDSALWDSEALAVSMLDQGQRPPLVVRLVTPFQIAADMNEWDIPTIAGDMIIAAEKALIENADAVLPISRSIAQTIQKCHDLQEGATWHDAPCGITYWPLFDVRENYAELEQIGNFSTTGQEDEKIILFIGRLERRKGVDILFEALPAILSGDPTARIVIAGTDSEGWERQIVKALPRAMTSRIYFLGNVSDAVRDKLLAHAHCLVFPSRYESFGLVPLEAFVHGVPVVASRSGAIPEVVLDGQCGLLFVQDDSAALASAVIRILGDDALHQRLSEGAIRRVRELSARNSAIRTCEIYSKLLPTELIEA